MQNWTSFLLMLAISTATVQAQVRGSMLVTVVSAEVDPAKPVDGALVQVTTLSGMDPGAHGWSKTNALGQANVPRGNMGDNGERQRIAVEPPASAASLVVYEPAGGLVDGLPQQLTVTMVTKGSDLLKRPGQVEARLNLLTLQNGKLTQKNRALTVEVQQQGQKLTEEDGLSKAIQEWSSETGLSSEVLEQTVQEWARDIQKKGDAASLEQRALAELALRHYGEAAQDYQDSAAIDSDDAEASEKKRTEQIDQDWTKWVRKMEQSANLIGLDHRFEEQTALQRKVSEKMREQHEDYPKDPQLRDLWLEARTELAAGLEWEGQSGYQWDPDAAQKRIGALKQSIRTWEDLEADYGKTGDRETEAKMQCYLGDADRLLSERTDQPEEGRKLLQAAVDALQNSVETDPKLQSSDVWADCQMKLGVAYFTLSEATEGEPGRQLLLKAVNSHQDALQVMANDPDAWTAARPREYMNLGNTFDDLAQRAARDDAHKLYAQAVDAYQHALQLESIEGSPQDWAETQENLGISYYRQSLQAPSQDARRLLQKAIEAHGNVLQVVTKQAQPHFWESEHVALAQCYLAFARQMDNSGQLPEEMMYLRFARTAFESASQIDPDLDDAIQDVNSRFMEVGSGDFKEQ